MLKSIGEAYWIVKLRIIQRSPSNYIRDIKLSGVFRMDLCLSMMEFVMKISN